MKQFQGDGLTFVDPLAHKTRSLKFDGSDRLSNEGTAARQGVSSSLRRVNDRTVVITNRLDAKVANTEAFALSRDLKTLTMTVRIVGRDMPDVLTFERK